MSDRGWAVLGRGSPWSLWGDPIGGSDESELTSTPRSWRLSIVRVRGSSFCFQHKHRVAGEELDTALIPGGIHFADLLGLVRS